MSVNPNEIGPGFSGDHTQKIVELLQENSSSLSVENNLANNTVLQSHIVNTDAQHFQLQTSDKVLGGRVEQAHIIQCLNLNTLPVNETCPSNEGVITLGATQLSLADPSKEIGTNLHIVNSSATSALVLHNAELATSHTVLHQPQQIQDHGFSNLVFATIQPPVATLPPGPITFQTLHSQPVLQEPSCPPLPPLPQPQPPQKQSKPKYFCVETHIDVEETIRKHTEETFSHFVVAKKTKAFGSSVSTIDLSTKFRIHWQSRDLTSTEECAVQIPYEGVPFIYIGEKAYMCHLGRSKASKQKEILTNEKGEGKLHRSRLTRKQGCPAKIFVKQIAKFPEFSIPNNTEYLRTQMSHKLRKALQSNKGDLEHIIQYVGTLPHITEHTNHEIGEGTPVREPIDPTIREKIVELAWKYGDLHTVLPKQIKEALDIFVEDDLFKGKSPPSKQRRRFYPSEKDIGNYVYKARLLTKLSIHEINLLHNHVHKMQQEHPDILISFKIDIDGFVADPETLSADSALKFSMPSLLSEHRIVFCCQSPDQQRLLNRYGKQAILLEISKEAKNLPFPLFGLFVPTNVDFQLVYLFMVQSKLPKSIKDGLKSLQEWNPNWTLKFLCVDYVKERLEVFDELFPECNIYINETSRKKSWKEWLCNPFNASAIEGAAGDTKDGDTKDALYERLDAIACSYTEESLNKSAQDLENSEVWKLSEHLRGWFSSEWLSEAKRWVVGYRHDEFMSMLHLPDDVIHGDLHVLTETHYAYMKTKKIGEFLTDYVTSFMPNLYRRYVDRNVVTYRKQFNAGNSATDTPTYLLNKPDPVIKHIQTQINNSSNTEYTVSQVQPGLFFVQDKSENNVAYSVSFGDATNLPSCGCLEWLKYKLPCTHMVAIFHGFQGWGWDVLSPLYIGNPVLTLDFSSFDKMQEDSLLETLQEVRDLNHEHEKIESENDKSDMLMQQASLKPSDLSVTDKLMGIMKTSKQPVLPLPVVNGNTLEALTIQKTLYKNTQQAGTALVTCDNVRQELSTAIKNVDDRSTLHKLKLDLQFVLNDVKFELSKLPQHTEHDLRKAGDKRSIDSGDAETSCESDTKKGRIKNEEGVSTTQINDSASGSMGVVEPPSSDSVVWLDDPELGVKLYFQHREAILKGDALSLDVLRCVQKILRHQFHDVTGFVDPELLEKKDAAELERYGTEKKVLQLHKTDCGHWAASTRVERNVNIHCCALTSKASIIEQVLKMIEEGGGIGDNILFIERPEKNTTGAIKACGLYAVAYCVAFAFDIEAKNLVFDEDKMRVHLAECLEDMCFSMFPVIYS